MSNDDERDYEEEAANQRLLDEPDPGVMDDDYVAPDALSGADDRESEAAKFRRHRQTTDAEKAEKCKCGHQRAVHAGHDGLGRCVMSRCRNVGSCPEFNRA